MLRFVKPGPRREVERYLDGKPFERTQVGMTRIKSRKFAKSQKYVDIKETDPSNRGGEEYY